MLLESEIDEEKQVKNVYVQTPYGWSAVQKVYKTIPLRIFRLETNGGKFIEGSAHHLVYTSDNWKELQDIEEDDWVYTEDGWESVIISRDTGKEDVLYDITIEDAGGAFFSNGVLSHNSTTFCARQLVMTHVLNNYKSLYVVPHHKQLETYGARFLQMEMAFLINSKQQNVYNKTYNNRSTISMIHCGETSQAARGKTADEVTIDECVTRYTQLSVIGLNKTISICDIPVGAKITGFDENNERTTAEITAKKCNGYRRCYRIRTASGKELICTGNHRIRTDRGWMYAIVLAGRLSVCSSSCGFEGASPETQGYDTCYSPYDLFLLRSGDVHNTMETQADSTLVDWENRMFEQGVSAAAGTIQEGAPKILIETERGVEWDSVKSIEYAGVHEVWDITTTPHHTFFADGIGVHNCQSLNPDHVEDILYTLTDSKMPTKIFAGTALSIDTLLEAKWSESSMGMWHVRSGDGAHWLNMYDKDVLYKVCNNPQGPTCPYTGKLLNITDGCFVHAYPGRQRDGMIGMHIPQCIIPDLAYNPIKWGAIYDKVKHTDFKKVLQECFGIAIAEGSREITSQDLQRLCVLPDTVDQLKQKCRTGYYRQIISGCDWGGSDYNPNIKSKTSYTVHCIIGLAPDNCIDILHYRRYSGMMYPDIAANIIKDHEEFKGNVMASDFGVGLAYNMEMRKYLPLDKHFVIGYVGPKAEGVSEPKDAHLDNQLSVNRTEAITNVFRDAKCLSPQKIRCRNWTDMRQYLEDWLNMFRVPTEDNTGRNTFKYIRAATKADDALHAFTFAYVMMKIYLGESLVQDPQLAAKLRQILSGSSILSSNEELMNDMFGEPVYCISG